MNRTMRCINFVLGLRTCPCRQVRRIGLAILTNFKQCSATAAFFVEIFKSMSSKVDPSRGTGAALYGPRISRALVDQLESQLRTLGMPTISVATTAPKVKRCEAPLPALLPIGPVHLRTDQLESALDCVGKAARAMAKLDEEAFGANERASMYDVLNELERRLHAFEGEFATMAGKLRDARRETEEQRQRALAAETKLESLMAAVAKIVAPLGSAEVGARAKPLSLRAALIDDEVTI